MLLINVTNRPTSIARYRIFGTPDKNGYEIVSSNYWDLELPPEASVKLQDCLYVPYKNTYTLRSPLIFTGVTLKVNDRRGRQCKSGLRQRVHNNVWWTKSIGKKSTWRESQTPVYPRNMLSHYEALQKIVCFEFIVRKNCSAFPTYLFIPLVFFIRVRSYMMDGGTRSLVW